MIMHAGCNTQYSQSQAASTSSKYGSCEVNKKRDYIQLKISMLESSELLQGSRQHTGQHTSKPRPRSERD